MTSHLVLAPDATIDLQLHTTFSDGDSHGPEKKPIKYRAELSLSLLERLGIQLK